MSKSQHHIWCNYFHGPVDKCKMCKRLRKEYPDDELKPDELWKKYFPDTIKRN